jgi:hypothetical protein
MPRRCRGTTRRDEKTKAILAESADRGPLAKTFWTLIKIGVEMA